MNAIEEQRAVVEEALSYADGVVALSRFLKKEWSYENLKFLLCVRQLNPRLCVENLFVPKVIPPRCDTEMKKIEYIYSEFIPTSSPSAVNIGYPLQKALEDLYEDVRLEADSFDAAYGAIFNLVATDSFKRFKLTVEYKAFVKKLHP